MANNVYIGNRYVPVFADPVEWNNLRTYEPLTIVTFQGTSYTSKKQVPVGIELSNTDYWVVTGNYNAYIQEVADDVQELTTNVDAISNKVNVLSRINNAKNIILVGDSWGTGQYATHGWCYYLTNLLSDSTVYTASANGAGFVGYNNVTFLNTLQNIAGSVSDKDSIELILVAGGLNDQGESGISTAITNFMSYVNTTYPNAIVLNVAINNSIGNTVSGSNMDWSYLNDYASLNGYLNKYFFVDKTNSAPYKLYVNSNHLTDAGNSIVANTLYSLIRGFNEYSYGYSEYNGTAFKNTTAIGSQLSVTVSAKEYKDCYYASIGSITIGTFAPSGFLTDIDFVKDSNDIFPFNDGDYSHLAIASASVNGESAVTFPVMYKFVNANTLRLSLLNFGRGSNVTYTNLYIFAATIIVPKSVY